MMSTTPNPLTSYLAVPLYAVALASCVVGCTQEKQTIVAQASPRSSEPNADLPEVVVTASRTEERGRQ